MTEQRPTAESLRAKLLGWLLPPLLLVMLVSSVVTYALALEFAHSAYDSGLYDTAQSLAARVRVSPEGTELRLPDTVRETLESDPYDTVYLSVVKPGGEVVGGHHELPPPKAMPTRAEPVHYYDTNVGSVRVRAAALGVFLHNQSPAALILVGETLVKRSRLANEVLITVLIAQALLIVLAAALVWLGIRRGLAPLQRVANAVTRRSMSDLRTVNDKDAPEEVRSLIGAINDLMARLSVALSAQQRFIADAAHQVRTPLAGIIAQSERAMREQDPRAVQAALHQLNGASKRAVRLFNQLLTLARAEPAATGTARHARVDLAQLARQACADWVPHALARGTDLGYAGEEKPAVIEGDEFLLSELLNNLIDNAIRYGRQGGNVTVTLDVSDGVVLAVEDDGPGVPPEEARLIFERFHRMPNSAPGGCGLGLAIVREIAQVHGARAEVVPTSPAGGATFRILFPRIVQ